MTRNTISSLVLGFTVALRASCALASPQIITNNSVWHDSAGNEIIAQGGSMLKVGGTYYWYGFDTSSADDVRCYSSTDLAHWTFVGISWNGTTWHGRPDVLFNSSTGKYVMITETPNGRGRNGVAYLTSSTPTGVFTLQRTDTSVDGQNMGDHSVFQDTDGTAYLLAVTDDIGVPRDQQNLYMRIVKLNPDYLSQNSVIMRWTNSPSDKREAPSILKRGSTYYFFTSRTNGWGSSETKYWRSTSLSGGWSALTLAGTVPSSSDSFNTQHDFIITVNGTAGTSYIYAGDRYSQFTGVGVGKNAWYPLTFDGNGNPTINGYGQWSIDVATGLWSANTGGIMPDGTYRITSKNSGKSVDAYQHGTGNGTLVQQWTYGGNANQKWTVFYLGSNQYKIIGAESGRALEVAGASTADGAGIDLWDFNGGLNQVWTITAVSGGYNSVIAAHSGKALNTAGSSTADGAHLEQWRYAGWTSELWQFQAP